jgi:hypothetical protein
MNTSRIAFGSRSSARGTRIKGCHRFLTSAYCRRMSTESRDHPSQSSSWLGSLWTRRGAPKALIGEVRAVEGEVLTLALIGMANGKPLDVAQLPAPTENTPVVQVTTESLIKGWQRVGTARRESWQRFRPMNQG